MRLKRFLALLAVGVTAQALPSRAEVMLQYFNLSWRELADKMPELAEVGYGAMWLPPPTKASGGLSVGYDLWDPFDLGGKDQRNTISTRYGTESELQHMVEVAHRFGIKIYWDNIMNHRAFDIPGFNETTPIDIYPGLVPEDFHLRVTEDGFYRKWDNTRDWNDAWQVQNLGLSDLIDIAHENPNTNFGPNEGDDHPKITFIRQPNNPEYYLDLDLPFSVSNPGGTFNVYTFANKEPFQDTGYGTNFVGAGNGRFDWLDANSNGQHDAGEVSEPFTDTGLDPNRVGWQTAARGFGDGRYNMGNPIPEDVNALLIRAARWLMDRTAADGLRLDAVKHVPDYFFGKQFGADKDYSGDGYTGGAQVQFNITRGFSDWENHRNSFFNTAVARDDAFIFGEHLGSPPPFGGYIDAGMRLKDAPLRDKLNGILGQPWGNLSGLDVANGGSSFGGGVQFANSHDSDFSAARELQHIFYLTRIGYPNIYTDGNYKAGTLGASGGAFPRHANTRFLGQFNDSRLPNGVYINEHFARGDQVPRWADNDVVAYERVDKRENGAMSDSDGVVLLFMMNDNFAAGQYREISTHFAPGSRLWQYSTGGGNFYATVAGDGKVKTVIPPGGYFAFSWRSPEASDLWSGFGGRPISITQNGQPVGTMSYVRKDGPDGDPGFNPYGVADANTTDFAYTWSVPRVTSATNLRFIARTDGSAVNVMFKLNGGVDINSQMGLAGYGGDTFFKRDNPPGINDPLQGTDLFVGYEQGRFVKRQFREKFAARNTESNNVIGSAGAETYIATIGVSTNFTINTGATGRDSDTDTAQFVYHDPADNLTASAQPVTKLFHPAPNLAAGTNIAVWIKVGFGCQVSRGYLYYTTDGLTFPEGAGGEPGNPATRVVEMSYVAGDTGDPSIDWWRAILPAQTNGTILRYKTSVAKQQGDGCGGSLFAVFPNDDFSINNKKSMMGVWEITNFNARTAVYAIHNDYGTYRTGLVEGFNFLQARAFLERGGRASIYNTFKQTFYYDASTPTGQVVFPVQSEVLGSQEYGAVVRTDPTVREVWYNILDNSVLNDDGSTTATNGNGTNAVGQLSWARATRVTASPNINSPYPDEWRFTYRNIPSSGNVTMQVRLVEWTSSTNFTLSDAQGHYTTLQRLVTAAAPTQALFVAFPSTDGDIVDSNYVMKIYFSNYLADNISSNDLKNRFLIRINGSAQNRDDYQIIYSNIGGQFHELAFRLPNLFNGQTNFLHNIAVTHTTGSGVILQASRFVRAAPAAVGPYVAIIDPLEFDLNGTPQVITLNDIPSPAPEDRSYTIQVETDLNASNVWIQFTGTPGGTAVRLPSVQTPLPGLVNVTSGSTNLAGVERTLSGTVAVTFSNNTVTGTGTDFLTQLRVGNQVRISTNVVTVTQLVSATSARLASPYPGSTASGQSAFQRPAFDVSVANGSVLSISNTLVTVAAIQTASNLSLVSAFPATSRTNAHAFRVDANPALNGNRLLWQFLWTNMTAGQFTFVANVDTDGNTNTIENSAVRNIRVILRQLVSENLSDFDDDDDGVYDTDETTAKPLPASNSETWVNGDVHVWQIYGRSDPLSPDTDGDGLPDGLELGWSVPIDTAMTDTNADTNADGWRNFRPDLDPPFYNTVPDNSCVPGWNFNASRTMLLRGGITDPGNPDTDGDGIPDGIEDWNRNGWVDGDGSPLTPGSDKCSRASWPDGQWDTAWTETDPNKSDTDGDGLSDGFGEDTDFNGWIAGDLNSNRVWNAGELWTETNPLRPDTDGDGLPDGWEVQYGFDPLDSGVIGFTNMRTGLLITNTLNGASGNPDGDVIVVSGVTNAYSNLLEFQNGTNPRFADTGSGPPAGSITIGRGPALGVVGGVTNFQEFTDWTWDDLILLDEYEGGGFNNQGGDLYLAFDGFDSSRDMVAFYARDGGDTGLGGDGNFYFRVDFHDLKAFAEDGFVDLYVVIDTGNPNAGESALPNEVDFRTSNRWEAVVYVDRGNTGKVYVDTDPNNNSSSINAPLASFGVVARDQNTPNGFKFAYFNSELDAVEFSISRQALIDAGWNGIDADDLNYQVFSTKDNNCNTCGANGSAGPGDIGGRNDIRDTFYDDFMAEDYGDAQAGIPSTLNSYFSGGLKSGAAKVSTVIHGNQAIQPGSFIQNLINNGQAGGYYRPLAVHEVYRAPLNLHITPTLASAIQWARVDTNQSPPWRDGPGFNNWIRQLIQTNVVYLMASTFSDHMLPYFTLPFIADNDALARQFLQEIYGVTITSNHVFWTPERLADDDVLNKIRTVMGYRATVLDQMEHAFTWFGRTAALGDDGYKINRINGVETFFINNGASDFRFTNTDNGLGLSLRALFNRKARGAQDQVITWFGNWEEYGDVAKATAYDRNIRWIANRPWIRIVALEQILRGEVDASADGIGDQWFKIDRGFAARPKIAQNYVNYASQGNYDNWYLGSAQEEGLFNKIFQVRPGVNVSTNYGMMFFPGLITNTWDQVITTADSNLSFLARSVLHASVFQTAFHNQPNVDLRKFSIGTYINPDNSSNTLAGFAAFAQAQTRFAAMYERVDDWASLAASVTTPQVAAEDIDLDGENEYLLYNDRIFGVFERTGGRLVAAWVRDILDGTVYQALGNAVGYSGSATEEEGTFNADGSGNVNAYRTSGLKDWFTTKGGGTNYVNHVFSFTNWTNGWRIVSADGQVAKTVTLQPKHWAFRVAYNLTGAMSNQVLYIRNGLSPNLGDLLLRGQQTLGLAQDAGGIVAVINTNYGTTVSSFVQYAGDGHTTGYNALANDENDLAPFFTFTMRNQAQTHQIELVGTNSFSFALGFRARASDWDGDGLPNVYEDGYPFLDPANAGDGALDQDGDGVNNADEYVMGTIPNNGASYLRVDQQMATPTGIVVRFPSALNREYFIRYGSNLLNTVWLPANTNAITGTGGTVTWIDDGTLTTPSPLAVSNRNYRIDVQLPP